MKLRSKNIGTGLLVLLILGVVASLVAVGCGGDSGSESGDAGEEIVLGVDASMSGALAGFGAYQKWAVEAAVADRNAEGGVTVDGKQAKIKIVLLDDKSDANVAASNVDTLVTKHKAVAIIGPVTPTVGNPASLAAERLGVPYIETGNPLEPFLSVKDQFEWAWDFFISGAGQGEAVFKCAQETGVQEKMNGKAAFAVDNSADGDVFLSVWKAFAPKYGWEFEVMPAFPANATEFGNLINALKASDADLVTALGDTPTLVAMRKQMDAVGYKPKMLDMERGAQLQQFGDALGAVADGVCVPSYWLPSLPFPGAKELGERFEQESDLSMGQILGPEYAAAQVMMDAITRAGSTDPAEINAAIAQTDDTYVCGPIKFNDKHVSEMEAFFTQWQDNQTVIVWPADWAEAEFIFPLP